MAGSGQSGANQTRILPRFYQPMNNHHEKRVLTTGHGGCTFTVRQTRTGAIPEAGGTADADGARAQARNLSAFCCADSRPLHRAVAQSYWRPGAAEWVLGVGIARGQRLVDVDAKPGFGGRPHHAVTNLWSSGEDLLA